ncbi:YlcG family protein [Escherichia coli]|nr:YlcG family protein [Escherichia coli]
MSWSHYLRLYRFPGSVLTDYRILKNYAKTLTGAGV